MYGHGHHGLMLAAAAPASAGAALMIGWIAMAAITLMFLLFAIVQLVRPGGKIRP